MYRRALRIAFIILLLAVILFATGVSVLSDCEDRQREEAPFGRGREKKPMQITYAITRMNYSLALHVAVVTI